MASYDGDIQLTVDLQPGDAVAAAEKINRDVQRVFDKADGKKVSAQFMSLQNSLNNASVKANELLDRMSEMRGVEFPTAEYIELNNEIETVSQNLENARQRSAQLSQQMNELGSKQIPTQEYKEVQSQIEKTQAKLDAAIERKNKFLATGGKTSSKTYKSLQYDIDQLTNTLQFAKQDAQDLVDTGAAFKLGTDTQEYGQLQTNLNEVNSEVSQLQTSYQDLVSERQEMENGGLATVLGEETTEYQHMEEQLNSVNNRMVMLLHKLYALKEVHFGTAITGALIKIKDAAFQVVKTLSKIGAMGIRAGIKRLSSALGDLHKHTNRQNNALGMGFKQFIKYGLGFRSLFALVNKLRRALIEGFEELAKESPSFNAAMSSIITSLDYLKRSFASAFAPIIETIAPILSQFINMTAQAVSNVGQLIAALTGKDFTKAVPVQKDYAESAKDSASNTNKAASATKKRNKEEKELQKTLAGFDDVEILHDNKKNKDKEEEKQPAKFSTSPITNSLNDFAKKLKDMWKNADFSQLGRLLGEKLKEALEKIPWDAIKAVLRKIAKSIATFLNGFLETPGLFYTIGKTIAEALNSAFEFVYAFITNFHWDSLGNAIRDGILGIVDNLDWNLIFNTLRELGNGLATTLNSAFANPEIWSGILVTLAKALNALIYGLQVFITTLRWGDIGSSFAKGLNDAVNTLDWMAAGQTLSEGIKGLLDLFIQFIENFDWENLGHKLGEFLVSIDWGGIFSKVFEIIGAILGGLAQFLWGFIEDAWNKVVEWCQETTYKDGHLSIEGFLKGIIDALANIGGWAYDHIFKPFIEGVERAFGIKSPSKEMKTRGGYVVEGFLNGIIEGLASIGTWVVNNIFKPVMNAISHAFNIVGNVARQLIDSGKSIISGIYEGITNTWHTITSFFSGNKSDINDQFSLSDFFSIGDDIINGIYDGISDGWRWLTNKVGDLAEDLLDAAKNALGISSPSKEFAWVGKMMDEGLTRGIEDSANTPLDAMQTITDKLIKDTSELNPEVVVGTSLSNIDSLLDANLDIFSNTIVEQFTQLIETLTRLGETLSTTLPPVVRGKVVPYSVTSVGNNTDKSDIQRLIDLLNTMDIVTREDLDAVITDALRRMPINLYIGDEQIARHANSGNLKLNRRFGTT